MRNIFCLLSFCTLCLMSCQNDINKSDYDAFNSPKIVKETASTSYQLVPAKSNVAWICGLEFSSEEHNGNIKIKSAKLSLNDDIIEAAQFVFDMESISNNDIGDATERSNLIQFIKSADFFYVDSFPTATFVLSEIAYKDDMNNRNRSCVVKGQLSIKNISREISFPASVSCDHHEVHLEADFTIARKNWNINYGSHSGIKTVIREMAINDLINIKLDISAEKMES